MKPKIAIDIDDVLAASAEGLVAYSNERWGLNLTVDDYDEHWGRMWRIDDDTETERRAAEFHTLGVVGSYKPRVEAVAVLRALSRRFELVVVTARRQVIAAETQEWLERHFPGVFAEVYYAGMWDNNHPERHSATKTELIRKIGAGYLIDDQLKHCLAAAEAGVPAVLFGRYTWNRAEKLPDNVTRCEDWQQVQNYFEAR